MRILVVGAGATGGFYGGRRAEAGRDVTFLVRAGRAAQLQADGLRIVSPAGESVIRPNLVQAGAVGGPYDVVLVGLKAYALEAAMEDFAPAVGAETIVVPLLNGMRHIELLVGRFGERPIAGGVSRVSTEVDAAGRIVQLTPAQMLVFGERAGGASERMTALRVGIEGTGFEVEISPNIIARMWEKWVMLASLGAITCLFRGTIGEVAAVSGGLEMELAILAECGAVAAACGYPMSENGMAWARSLVARPGGPMTASMYRDMMNGGRVEADHILGDLIARGREHGVECPIVSTAYVALSVYLDRRSTAPGHDDKG
jgi:2-dehydropantoate 2-reductase